MGVFSLTNGRREQISSQTKSTTYIVYNSSILWCRHPDSSFLFQCSAKWYRHSHYWKSGIPLLLTSTSQHALLLTMQLFSFPGNASSEEYHTSLPNFLHPIIFGVSHISSVGHSTKSPRTFTISMCTYLEPLFLCRLGAISDFLSI